MRNRPTRARLAFLRKFAKRSIVVLMGLAAVTALG